MPEHSFIIKGDICHSLAPGELECAGGAYLVCEDGRSAGIFREVPERWTGLPVEDCTGRLVLPGWWTCTSTPRSLPTAARAWTWSCSTG